ncbi:hypothetical protein BB561_005599 [Smittium simulii]|uniref:Uncharacterized protein n=1 Tax=Smittium simulii TaxID=133385 RepID=A0A2T9Y9M7_9FUNG|nr:hypothetical protein BB561_005599 [Smittium simulii]
MKLIFPSRVKVYELSTQDSWKDLGTGYCSFVYENNSYKIKVLSEDEESKYILDNELILTEKYQKEQASLIVWTENGERDMALSFQDSESCQEIWEKIKKVQIENGYGSDSESDTKMDDSTNLLPDPSVANLSAIEEILARNSYAPNFRDKIAQFILKENYIDKLIGVLDTCESLDDVDDACTLYRLMKYIVLYNDSSIFEHIIKDERFNGFVGIMEYDPGFLDEKDKYREFLSNHLSFKEIVTIGDKEIENKIHQVFRLQYLKDVVLARLFDDAVNSTLSSLIIFYNIDIIDFIKNNSAFQVALFDLFKNPNESINDPDLENFLSLFYEKYAKSELLSLNESNKNRMLQLSEELKKQNSIQESGHNAEPPANGIRGWSTRIFDEGEEAYFDSSDNDEPDTNNEAHVDLSIDNISTEYISVYNPGIEVSTAQIIRKNNSMEIKIGKDYLNYRLQSKNFSSINSNSSEPDDISDINYCSDKIEINNNVEIQKLSNFYDSTNKDASSDHQISKDASNDLNIKNKNRIDTPIPSKKVKQDLKQSPTPNSTEYEYNDSYSGQFSPLTHRFLPSRAIDSDEDDKMEVLASKPLKRNYINMKDLKSTTSNDTKIINNSPKDPQSPVCDINSTERTIKKSKTDSPDSADSGDALSNFTCTPENTLNNHNLNEEPNLKKFGSPKKLSFVLSGNIRKSLNSPQKLTRSNSESISEDMLSSSSFFKSNTTPNSLSSIKKINIDSNSPKNTNCLEQTNQGQNQLITFKISPKHPRKNLSFGDSSIL